MRTHDRIIIAHHLVMTLYGHWLSNDPRGSGSQEIRKDELKDLGQLLPGQTVSATVIETDQAVLSARQSADGSRSFLDRFREEASDGGGCAGRDRTPSVYVLGVRDPFESRAPLDPSSPG
jgi:hypothetical protein